MRWLLLLALTGSMRVDRNGPPAPRSVRAESRPDSSKTRTCSGRKKPVVKRPRQKTVEPLGQVNSVTDTAAFLDRGATDGLVPGQTLTFTRGGKPAGTCIVDAISEHFARCAGTGLRQGDRFPVGRRPEPPPPGPAPLPTEAELARRAAALDTTDWKLRDFDSARARANGVGPRVEVLLSHTTWGNPNSEQGPFALQRLDAAVYDVELWKGLRASADVTVLNFSARPSVTHTVYQQSPVLLVRQLELGFRRADVPFTAAVGRTWLRSAIGLLVLDGAQAAWRFGENVEVGAYGGLLPDAARLSITPSQWTVGAFTRVRFSSGTGVTGTVGQVALRAGWSLRDVLGGRAEVALAASLWKGQSFDGQASVELGFGPTQGPAGLDAARLDLGWRPSQHLRFNGGVRYRGLPLTGLTELGTISPGQQALHADLAAVYVLSNGLQLAAHGGVASDFTAGLLQARVGPELSLPNLLGLPVGVSLGYQEELGWLRGRYGYLQTNVAPLGLFRVLTRVSWFQQQGSTSTAGSHELGGSFALEVTPWRFLNARVWVMGRAPLQPQRAALGSVGVQLGGAF
jgi:hypothetical protein